ncbi:MAG: hypothetical protein AAGG68_17945 [Bacteroidota bacterium]
MNHTDRLFLEWKKVNSKFYYIIILGLPTAVFLITCLFILFKKEALTNQPIELIIDNNIGSWYALLYPFTLLVIAQNLADTEHKHQLMLYAKSYKKHWFDLFAYKAIVATAILVLLTVLNICYNALLFKIASSFMEVGEGSRLLSETSLAFSKCAFVFLPAVFFHLMLSLLIEKNGIVYILGIFLIIVGIPIANLTDLVINPYSYGILIQKPDTAYLSLLVGGVFIVLGSLFLTNYRLKHK